MMSRSFVHKLLQLHAPLGVVFGVCTIASPISAEQSLGDRICNPQSQPVPPTPSGTSSTTPAYYPKPIPYPKSDSKPTTALEFYTQATEYYSDRTVDEEIAFLNKAITLLPNYIKAYIARAQFYTEQKMYDLAIADHQRVYQLDPSDEVRLLKNKAYLYSLSKQWEKLIQTYDRLLAIQPKKAGSIHLVKARAYSELKDWDNAIAEYSRSIRLSKDRWLNEFPEVSELPYISEPIFSRQSIEPNPSLTYFKARKDVFDHSKSDLGYFLGMGGGCDSFLSKMAEKLIGQGFWEITLHGSSSHLNLSQMTT